MKESTVLIIISTIGLVAYFIEQTDGLLISGFLCLVGALICTSIERASDKG